MKPTLVPGISYRRSIIVDRPRTIGFMGEDLRVYATPEMVRDIEETCRELMLQHGDSGEDSVGTRIEADHTGATLIGMTVEIAVTVTEVKGRLVSFEVSVRDPVEEVGRGRHTRFAVDMAKMGERLAAKAVKAKAV